MCVMLKTFASLFCRAKVKLISIRVSPTMPLMCKAILMWMCHLKKKFNMKNKMLCSQPAVLFVGMEFDSVEEARRVYNAYAFKMGFSIRVASSRNSIVTKELIRKEFECTHARRPDSEQEDNTSTSTATNDVSIAKASKRKSSTKDVAQAKASKKKSSSAVLTIA